MSPRRVAPKSKATSSGLPTWAIAVGIGVVVVLAAVGLFILQTPATPSPAVRDSSAPASGRTKGDPNAKLELVEYSDFQ
ncbi:MAG: hypothetical protein HZB51_23545 [Chloroflexi bacterium]|nr:hypothetical protein [Chloroflexota bacterium]